MVSSWYDDAMAEFLIPALLLGIFLMSVIAHEVSHGVVALALGDSTAKYAGRLTLNPIKHMDPFGSVVLPILSHFTFGFAFGYALPVPYNPYNLRNQQWGPALVAVAGPLTNIVLAVIMAGVYRLLPDAGGFVAVYADVLTYVILVNLWLAIFNLVPIPPLDGSKLLLAALPYRYHAWFHSLEMYGMFLVLGFVFFFSSYLFPLLYGAMTLLIGS